MNAGPLGQKGEERSISGKEEEKNQPIFIPLQQAFLYEDKQVERQVSLYEMESGLYQKILLVPTVECFEGAQRCCSGCNSREICVCVCK